MSTKKSILAAPKEMMFKAIDKTKWTLKSVNGLAIITTEEIVSEGIIAVEQWQTVANKALKGSLTLAAKQQDIVFDTLTGVKNHVVLSKKRISQLIA
jgi:hypothetical protein